MGYLANYWSALAYLNERNAYYQYIIPNAGYGTQTWIRAVSFSLRCLAI